MEQTINEQTDVEQTAVSLTETPSEVQPAEDSQQVSVADGEQQAISAPQTVHVAEEKSVLWFASRIWVIGMVVLAGYYAFGLWRIRRKLKKAVLAEDQSHHPGWRQIPIYECDSLPSPFAMGLLYPKIYLPYGMQPENREMVLLHEQYHIRRHDQIVKVMACLLLAVYWFHPLGFGEPNVKSRIQHVLKYKKAAVGTGVAAVVLIVAAFLLLGSNRSNPATNDGQTQTGGEVTADAETQAAELLYEARNPYVGDVSADGKLLSAIARARPDSLFADLAYKTELQTSEEPYEFHFLLETDVTDGTALDQDLSATAVLMLALTDNLGKVQWQYTASMDDGTEDQIISYVDIDQAQSLLGVDDLKAYAESPEKVQELLELVKQMNVEN